MLLTLFDAVHEFLHEVAGSKTTNSYQYAPLSTIVQHVRCDALSSISLFQVPDDYGTLDLAFTQSIIRIRTTHSRNMRACLTATLTAHLATHSLSFICPVCSVMIPMHVVVSLIPFDTKPHRVFRRKCALLRVVGGGVFATAVRIDVTLIINSLRHCAARSFGSSRDPVVVSCRMLLTAVLTHVRMSCAPLLARVVSRDAASFGDGGNSINLRVRVRYITECILLC